MTGLNSPKKHQMLGKWYGLDLIIASQACEAVEYGLMEAGALGTETKEVRQTSVCRSHGKLNDKVNFVGQSPLLVTAYFAEMPDREVIRTELAEAFRVYELPSSSVREMNVREVVDQDWLEEWKKGWQPVEVGERFIIAPPWSEIFDERGRIVIRIEPGMAFGTGTHETTRLCLAAIEKYFSGSGFLDVGTGTGILAIAAAKLSHEARVEACDTDADGIAIARKNARLNGVEERITFRVGTVEEATHSADVVCANLTSNAILNLLPTLIGATCGRLILSGILDSQAALVSSRLQECGVAVSETLQDGEWIAIVV